MEEKKDLGVELGSSDRLNIFTFCLPPGAVLRCAAEQVRYMDVANCESRLLFYSTGVEKPFHTVVLEILQDILKCSSSGFLTSLYIHAFL